MIVGKQGGTVCQYLPLTTIFFNESHLFSTKQVPVCMIQMCCVLSSCGLTVSQVCTGHQLYRNCTLNSCTVQMADLKSTKEQPPTLYSYDDWARVRHVMRWIAQCSVINCSNVRSDHQEWGRESKGKISSDSSSPQSAANLVRHVSLGRSPDTHLQWFMKITEIADKVCSHFPIQKINSCKEDYPFSWGKFAAIIILTIYQKTRTKISMFKIERCSLIT